MIRASSLASAALSSGTGVSPQPNRKNGSPPLIYELSPTVKSYTHARNAERVAGNYPSTRHNAALSRGAGTHLRTASEPHCERQISFAGTRAAAHRGHSRLAALGSFPACEPHSPTQKMASQVAACEMKTHRFRNCLIVPRPSVLCSAPSYWRTRYRIPP
jgi:hypothetical protein